MSSKNPNNNQRRKQAMMRIIIMAGILICVNVLASYFHTGFDLTKDNRFTLSPSTKKLLRNMQEVAVIDVYLKGKFPAEVQRLQEAVRERLTSFKEIAGTKIIFHFIDPLEGKTEAEQKQIVKDMAQKGMLLQEIHNNNEDNEEQSYKYFFPYALVHYNGKELPISLSETPPGKSLAEQINYTEAMLEHKFADALARLQRRSPARIAYITGNGEDLGIRTVDMLTSLPGIYFLDTLDLMHTHQMISLAYDAIIINQPKITFTLPEKIRIDQYIMYGGHVLWNVNQLDASIDSLELHPPQIMAMEYGLDLDEILFKYGVRINNDLVEDRQNVPLARIMNNGTPELHEWIYFPKLNPTSGHPIVRNMDFIFGQFTNSIDTLLTTGIKKTILLQTSKYSVTAPSPVRVSLTMMSFPLNNDRFNKPYRPVAVLLEGIFTSAFRNRLAPETLSYLKDSTTTPFKPKSDSDNSMIVTSIGNLFSNDYSTKSGVIPMGYYRYDHEYYANKSFLLNCLEYLTDPSGILESRSKQVKLRLLDNGRAKDEKTQWQVVNIAIPIASVLVFASCYLFFRKRRYEIKHKTPDNK